MDINSKLCSYDTRNPHHVHDEESKALYQENNSCKCDNCFYGRTKLATTIITLTANAARSDELIQQLFNHLIATPQPTDQFKQLVANTRLHLAISKESKAWNGIDSDAWYKEVRGD